MNRESLNPKLAKRCEKCNGFILDKEQTLFASDICFSCDKMLAFLLISIGIPLCLLLIGGPGSLLSLLFLEYPSKHSILRSQISDRAFLSGAVPSIVLFIVVNTILTFLKKKNGWLYWKSRFLLFYWLASLIIMFLASYFFFYGASSSFLIGESNRIAVESINLYEKTKDYSCLARASQLDITAGDKIFLYLFDTQDSILIRLHTDILNVVEQSIRSSSGEIRTRYNYDYGMENGHRVDNEFRTCTRDFDRSTGIFKGLRIYDLNTLLSISRSVIFIDYINNRVGTYTDGTTAISTDARVYVIDNRRNVVIAYYIVSGGPPSKTVSSSNIFSSPHGPEPDMDEIRRLYFNLPLEE